MRPDHRPPASRQHNREHTKRTDGIEPHFQPSIKAVRYEERRYNEK